MVEKSLIKKNCIGFVLYLVAGLSNEAVYITHFFMPFAIHLLYTFFKKKCITLIFKALKVTFACSHWSCSVHRGVLKTFAKFTRKHLCQSVFFNKVAGLMPTTLLKERPLHKCFPVNFAKFLRTTSLPEHLRWLLLIFLNCTALNLLFLFLENIHDKYLY